jgi:hypothetical protein
MSVKRTVVLFFCLINLALFSACGGGSSKTTSVVDTVTLPPTITGVSPASGSVAGGTSVTITGTNFAATVSVTFGGTAAAIISRTSTQIVCNTPAHAAGTVDVQVTNPGQAPATLVGGFQYLSTTITSVAPNTGPAAGGTTVTITGTNFLPGATVSFGGTAATSVTFVSQTQLSAVTPAHAAGAVNVVVTNSATDTATLTGGFTYVSPISISTTSLPNATVGVAYSQTLTVTGGVAPYTWTLLSGALPGGIFLQTNGTLSGAALASGTFNFTVKVTDAGGSSATQALSLIVSATLPGGQIPLTACGTLTLAGGVYQLQNDVTAAGTCFSVQASNVVLDLNNHMVTYATSDGSGHRHGVLGLACFDPDVAGNPCGGNAANLTVMNGKIVQGAAAAPFSHAIQMGQINFVQNLTVHDLDITISSPSSVGILTSFSLGGASIYNNTIHNNVTSIASRHNFDGMSIHINNDSGAATPNQIHHNVIIGGAQGGIRDTNTKGSEIYNNDISQTAIFSNGFCIDAAGANMKVHDNLCHPVQGRGIHANSPSTQIYNNIIDVTDRANNFEYGTTISSITRAGNVVTVVTGGNHNQIVGSQVMIRNVADASFNGTFSVASVLTGQSFTYNQTGANAVSSGGETSACQVGGVYGIQVESDLQPINNVQIFGNTVTARAGECTASGLRMTSIAAGTTVNIHDNTFAGKRIALVGGQPTTRQARSISLNDANGSAVTFLNNVLTSDYAVLHVDFDGGNNFTLRNSTVGVGTNPDTNWYLAEFRTSGGGQNSAGLVFLDTTFQAGAADTQFFLQAGPQIQEFSSKYTFALTVGDQHPLPVSGAAVVITNALAQTVFSGTTDSLGKVSATLTKVRVFNSVSAVTTEVHNPHSVSVTKSGCAPAPDTFSVSVPGTVAATRVLTCP